MSTTVYNDSWNASELRGRRTWWLLDITYAGTVYRLAESNLEITSTSLGSLRYLPCILNDITVGYGFSLFGDSAEQQSVSVECFLGPIDVAAMMAAGHDLAGSPCVLSKWIEGQDYDDRRVFVVGRMKNPVYGGAGEPIRFTLEDAFFDDYAMIPDSEARVSGTTTNPATVGSSDLGLAYPIVFGNPGKCSTLPAGWCSGTQGVWRNKLANLQELVIAGHATNITRVILCNDDWSSGGYYAATQSADDLGRPITVIVSAYGEAMTVTIPPAAVGMNGVGGYPALLAVYDPADASLNKETPAYVAWYTGDADDHSGGLFQNGRVVRGAGDVIQYVLGFSKYRFDARRIAGIADQLNTYAIDATIDAQVRPWDWVRSNLIPILPVSVTSGTNGIYFVPWASASGNPVITLDDGIDRSVEFARTIETDTQQICNDLTLEYALDVRTDTYQQALRALPSPEHPPVATLVTLGSGSILLTSTEAGVKGLGVTVEVDGNVVPGVVEDTVARTVLVKIDLATHDTLQSVVDLINSGATLIRAALREGSDPTQQVNGFYNIDGTPGFLTAAFAQTVTLVDGSATSQLYTPYVALSQNRYQYISGDGSGVLADTMESICIYDPATAGAVLSWRTRAFAFAHRSLQGMAPENKYGWLQLGQEVAVTCSRLSLSAQSMIVQRLEYSNDGMVAFTLAWIEDPFRDG